MPTKATSQPSYWQTEEGRLEEAIRRGLRDAGVKGMLAHLVAPILSHVLAEIRKAR